MDINIDLSEIVLETERLILRPWKDTDLDDFYEYASVPGVGEMAGWKHHENAVETKRILDMFISDKNIFAVVYKENNKVIGSLGLHGSWANSDPDYSGLKIKEIGYTLSKDYWGRGLMPEAVKSVIEYCFDTRGLDALTICHFITNLQSKRVIEKCGFTFVKESVYYSKQTDQKYDELQYILHKSKA